MPVAHTVEIDSVGAVSFQVSIASGAQRGSKMSMALDRGSCSVEPDVQQAGSANPQSRLKDRTVPCIGLKEGAVVCSRIGCIASDADEAHDYGDPASPRLSCRTLCTECADPICRTAGHVTHTADRLA